MPAMNKPQQKIKSQQTLRIIGGEWRGRKLSFSPQPGLRPTLDRFREMLFNWLMFDIEGARCLDLFAGSGALGLEALSRGASEVIFTERDKMAAQQIQSHLKQLKTNQGTVISTDALVWLKEKSAPPNSKDKPQNFDVVFLDPPFHKDLLDQALTILFTNGYINNHGYIYIEAEGGYQLPSLPSGWQLNRQKTAKNKVFFLIKKSSQS